MSKIRLTLGNNKNKSQRGYLRGIMNRSFIPKDPKGDAMVRCLKVLQQFQNIHNQSRNSGTK